MVAPVIMVFVIGSILMGPHIDDLRRYLEQGRRPVDLLAAIQSLRDLTFRSVLLLGAAVLVGLLDKILWEIAPARGFEHRPYPRGGVTRFVDQLRSIGLGDLKRRD